MAKKNRRVPRYQRKAEAEGRADKAVHSIPADLSQQAPNNSYSPPLLYVDCEFTCVDCGCCEVWTAEQQKWWYEVAKGSIYTKAIRCGACRKAFRTRARRTEE